VKTVRIEELIDRLPSLLAEVEAGEEIVLLEGESPVARLIPPGATPPARVLGFARGKFVVPDDFDDPLPAEVLNAFEGKA
jgi:antitoxin (DNA-binding transcriptional repressor) of toxin-antitoxin stability system